MIFVVKDDWPERQRLEIGKGEVDRDQVVERARKRSAARAHLLRADFIAWRICCGVAS